MEKTRAGERERGMKKCTSSWTSNFIRLCPCRGNCNHQLQLHLIKSELGDRQFAKIEIDATANFKVSDATWQKGGGDVLTASSRNFQSSFGLPGLTTRFMQIAHKPPVATLGFS